MNIQNLHLQDKDLFLEYRTLFSTDIDSAHAVLEDSQLDNKYEDATLYNDNATIVRALEESFYTNVPLYLYNLLVGFDSDIINLSYKGDYDSAETYNVLNVVSYNNKLYVCSSANPITNVAPTNTSYWDELNLRGLKGASTFGSLLYQGQHSEASTYSQNDVVRSGNNLYYALSNVPSNTPITDTSYWNILATMEQRYIHLDSSNLQVDDIYWEEVS